MGYQGSNLWVSCMKGKCPTHYAIASIPPGVSCLWDRPCLCAPLTREALDSFSLILLLLGPSCFHQACSHIPSPGGGDSSGGPGGSFPSPCTIPLIAGSAHGKPQPVEFSGGSFGGSTACRLALGMPTVLVNVNPPSQLVKGITSVQHKGCPSWVWVLQGRRGLTHGVCNVCPQYQSESPAPQAVFLRPAELSPDSVSPCRLRGCE